MSDFRIIDLEAELVENPQNFQALQELVFLLEASANPSPEFGKHARAQSILINEFDVDKLAEDFFDPESLLHHVNRWKEIFAECGIKYCIPVAQLFFGNEHQINGVSANCSSRIALFDQTGAISEFCFGCYKVQILAQNVCAFFKLFSLIRNLELQGDNRRKCMVELREAIPFPYKAYVFCESAEQAEDIRSVVQELIVERDIADVFCGVSHGCSQYGLRYPEFRYSQDGSHENFVPPDEWGHFETEFFSKNPIKKKHERLGKKEYLSLRDVMCFLYWLQYAHFIRDFTVDSKSSKPDYLLPIQYQAPLKKHANKRIEERKQLKKRRAVSI